MNCPRTEAAVHFKRHRICDFISYFKLSKPNEHHKNWIETSTVRNT
jgi:hypothetical protein